MKSPRVTGGDVISESVNGSSPKESSNRVTRIAMPRESSPESSIPKSSVSGNGALPVSGSAVLLDARRISSSCEMIVALTDIRFLRGRRCRVGEHVFNQRAQHVYAFKKVFHGVARVVSERHLRTQSAI